MDLECAQLLTSGLVDSTLKLHLLLLRDHPRWCGDAVCLAEWLHESPWAVAEALEQLLLARLLVRVETHMHPPFKLRPGKEFATRLEHLGHCYDDPGQRDEIYRLVRAAYEERQFRALAFNSDSFELAA